MIVRSSTPDDVAGMTALLNAVIAVGGTTAHQVPMTEDRVRHAYVDGPDVLSSVVAITAGHVIGWQAVELWDGDPHIGTFVLPGQQARGVGSALFALTCPVLRQRGTRHVLAYIRADNRPGLAYYARIGFCDIGGDPDFTLTDGTRTGRIHRRFDL